MLLDMTTAESQEMFSMRVSQCATLQVDSREPRAVLNEGKSYSQHEGTASVRCYWT